VVVKGQKVCKTWYFKNTGITAITKGSALKRVSGDDIKITSQPTERQVNSSESFEISIEFEAPEIAGHYLMGMQIQYGQY